ncbi:hypothetical protein GCM10009738_80620 [Kitasatospora viridis]|uniref:Restriction endonuclease n=1 Tax=Kitasatospora viridis TaxID=281105 RepID=A0A561UCR5_9ACTN|nr:restriction endonuclease [Kitasatospora viridis]TWF97138.1 restriction endonuclease [Kitasatospora viridis]
MVAYEDPWKVFIPLRRKTLRAYPAPAMTAAPVTVAPGPSSPGGVLVVLKRTYRRLLARLALRALDEAFSVTPVELVGTVVLNGHVATTDPATGRAVRPCVVSMVVERADFAELVLDEPRLDPQRCLRNLGAVVSQHPHDLEPVPPIVDFDPARFKIAADTAVVGPLDSRPDLLQMDPFAFERLVRELFTAMGYETWRTQNSRDDGLDAVAVRRDPVGVTVIAVQAKRTKNVVSPEVVGRDPGRVRHRSVPPWSLTGKGRNGAGQLVSMPLPEPAPAPAPLQSQLHPRSAGKSTGEISGVIH